MKKLLLSIICLFFIQTFYAQEWHSISSKSDDSYSVNLIKSTDEAIVLELSINGFYTTPAPTPMSGTAVIISNEDMAPIAEAGYPNIPSLSIPVIINDHSKMDIRVKNVKYVEYSNIEIAPSKGNFSRKINPEDVPYTYADVYQQDAFLPLSQSKLDSPYILRDFRAQNIIVTPFAYNAVTKTLRVFHEMTIEVFAVKGEGENIMERRSNNISMNRDYSHMYKSRYINYQESSAKYDIVEEEGDLLIICHDDFMDAMQPFVNWKRATGRKTTMVGTSITGKQPDNIKAYITGQYNSNPDLTYVLLVGDYNHLQGKYLDMSDCSGRSDWWFGQLTGNDHYNELIIGRFSAETTDDVTVQVNKVIHYERDINANDTWLTIGQGISKKEGATGHNGEDDYQHIDKIRDDLLDYNYTQVHRDYSNVSGVSSSAAIVSQHINEGVGIINYCNHGYPTGWGVFSYGNNHVNSLTNDNKLPYIISTACNNGEYTYYTPCFAETWLRATNASTGNPTGAIGGMFSYISQPWVPPMYGQDEMIDVYVETYTNNIKRTMGGVSLHGNMKILDINHNNVSFYATYNTWHLFGDPTLMLRSDIPESMNVSHNSQMSEYSTTFTVSLSNADGACVTLTKDGEIMGTTIADNGMATLNYIPPLENGQATLTVFAHNRITYQSTIEIVESAEEMIIVNVTANKDVVAQGSSVMMSTAAYGGNGNYNYSWTPTTGVNGVNLPNPIVTPQETTTYTCTVSDGNVTGEGSITITVVTAPTALDAKVEGNSVELSWTETTPNSLYNIYRDNNRIASNIDATTYIDSNLPEGCYTYQVSSVYEGIESAKCESIEAVIYTLTVSTFANPGFIVEGESTTIFATANGASGEVSYSWTPAETLEDPTASSTTATPTKTTTYTVVVTCGSQTASAELFVKVLVHPENLTAEADGNDVTLEWDEVPEAEYYMVLRDGVTLNSYVPETTLIDEDVESGSHCYTVKSVYAAYVSFDSNEACVEIGGCEPPMNITAEYYEYDGEFGALVDWDRMESLSDLTEYRIYRSTDNNEYKLIQTLVNVPGMNHYQFSDMTNKAGTYYYKVSAYYADIDCESEFGMAADSSNDYVSVVVTSLDENANNNIELYPNPVKDKLYIKAEHINAVTIVNMMGQVVKKQDTNSDMMALDLSGIESGMYLIQIETVSGMTTRQINIIK